MAVSWAWAHGRGSRSTIGSTFTSTNTGASTNTKSFGSAVGSVVGSVQSVSWGSQATTSTGGTSRRRLRIWSRATFLDDIIDQLDKHRSNGGVLIHTADRGITEHENKAGAMAYLRSVRRERRRAQAGDDDGRSTFSSFQPTSRTSWRRKAPPRAVALEVNAEASLKDGKAVPTAVAEKEVLDECAREVSVPSVVSVLQSVPEKKELEVVATVCSGEASSEAETRVPSDDGCKAGADERLSDFQLVRHADPMDPRQFETRALERTRRLMEVQAVLDAAQPQEIVGLSIDVHEKRGTITEYTDGKFKVKFDSGGEIILDKITAPHLAATLPSWA